MPVFGSFCEVKGIPVITDLENTTFGNSKKNLSNRSVMSFHEKFFFGKQNCQKRKSGELHDDVI